MFSRYCSDYITLRKFLIPWSSVITTIFNIKHYQRVIIGSRQVYKTDHTLNIFIGNETHAVKTWFENNS